MATIPVSLMTTQEAQPCTERVARLRDAYFTYRPAICLERALSYTRSYRDTEQLATPVRRALALGRVCEEKSVTILDDELIVGMPAFQPRGAVICPEIAWRWLRATSSTPSPRASRTPTTSARSRRRCCATRSSPTGTAARWRSTTWPTCRADTRAIAVRDRDHRRRAQVGERTGRVLAGLRQHPAEEGLRAASPRRRGERMAALDPRRPGRLRQDPLPRVGRHRLRGGARCSPCGTRTRPSGWPPRRRTPERARRAAARSRHVCRRVPWEPPRTFHEALQLIWFGQVLLLLEENAPSYSPGRMDQYLYPLLRRRPGGRAAHAAQPPRSCSSACGSRWPA